MGGSDILKELIIYIKNDNNKQIKLYLYDFFGDIALSCPNIFSEYIDDMI